MKPQIDKLYVYRPSNKMTEGSFSKLDRKDYVNRSYPYKRGNTIEKSEAIYRYAKTIIIDDKRRTILLVTEDDSKTNVSKFFTESKKAISSNQSLLNTFIKVENVPLELDIQYVY